MSTTITIKSDLIVWNHDGGLCKLILVPRAEIDEDSEEYDAWELLWIDRDGLRRHEQRIDLAYGRTDPREAGEIAREYLSTADDDVIDAMENDPILSQILAC